MIIFYLFIEIIVILGGEVADENFIAKSSKYDQDTKEMPRLGLRT